MGSNGNGERRGPDLTGRKLYIPEMSYSGAAAFAAAFVKD